MIQLILDDVMFIFFISSLALVVGMMGRAGERVKDQTVAVYCRHLTATLRGESIDISVKGAT